MHLTLTVDGESRGHGLPQPSGRNHILSRGGGHDTTTIASSSTTFEPRTHGAFPQDCDPTEIPLAAALLAWRLLIIRSGEEDVVESIVLGRWGVGSAPSSSSNTTTTAVNGEDSPPNFEATLPKFPVASGGTIEQALQEAAHALAEADQDQHAVLGSQSTLYFSDACRSATRRPGGSGKTAETGPDWNLSIELRAADNSHLHIKTTWRTTHVTQSSATDGLHTFTSYLGAILSRQTASPTVVWDLIGPSNADLSQIWSWNATVPPTIPTPIHDLVSARMLLTPDKPAVEAWDGAFTYREVELLSNTLARQLRSCAGVRVGDVVLLVFEKSRWTTPALLGVLKAGAAFCLTDPSQPEARLRSIAALTGARAVVCSAAQEGLAGRLAEAAAASSASNGSGAATLGDAPLAEVEVLVASDATLLAHAGWGARTATYLPVVPASGPMYVIFTSGSTGAPKGVVVSHANFVSGAVPRAEAVGYRETSRVFEFASYAFDVSIDCMLCTLLAGGTVCVPSEAARMDGLGAAILASGANMAHMTPSVARVLDDGEQVMRSLDVLGLGGEAVSSGDAAAWSKLTRVIIAYGPSECTVGCTINSAVSEENTSIGKGTGGLTWVVDPEDHDRLMPVGSVGELLMEGPVVGLGYLGEPAKTAEVFIEDPKWLVEGHGVVPGRKGRMYKTGDLVQYDTDGSIVFVGRKDQQVKLRGQRVELTEVEHHLQLHLPHGVKIAAEVIKPSGAEPTLVVFVSEPHHLSPSSPLSPSRPTAEQNRTANSNDTNTAAFSQELAAILAEMDAILGDELPRYMVPAAYIPLHSMPTLPSAKIDRKKLRARGNAMAREQIAKFRTMGSADTKTGNTSTSSSMPTTALEKELQALWKRILATGDDLEIGMHDSFFALGGDSLRAMKLVSAARADGIILTVADVFANPTISALSRVAAKTDVSSSSATTVDPVPPFSLLPLDWSPTAARAEVAAILSGNLAESSIEDIYPCTPLQEGLMALSAKFQDSYVAQRVLELDDAETLQRLKDAFETASRDCAILRTRIVQVPGRGLQQVVLRGPIGWRGEGVSSVAEYLALDRREEMGLGTALVRYAVIYNHHGDDNKPGHAAFVLTMHHALYDGWSMPLVIERVNAAYDSLPPPARPAEFKHFIRFLSSSSDTDAAAAACESYWRGRLAGANGTQFPAPPHDGYVARADSLLEIQIHVPPRRTGSTSATSLAGTTVATIVRAAWAVVAARYSGERDVVFGETLTGRNAPVPGADLIEGPMITTVPVRVRVDGNMKVGDFLRAIHDTTVKQIPYEHTGLQHIRRVSPDALEACELRTGLVLHPAAGEDEETQDKQKAEEIARRYPASRLVPADDAEAAQEALKFNTYALMLVCSLAADGYFVMASFDSRAVDLATMERVLEQLRRVTERLCLAGDEGLLRDVDRGVFNGEDEFDELLALSKADVPTEVLVAGFDRGDLERVWLVDPDDSTRLVPRGAVGEVMVDANEALGLPTVETPGWYSRVQPPAEKDEPARTPRLYLTGSLAKFAANGSRVAMGTKAEREQRRRQSSQPVAITTEEPRKLPSGAGEDDNLSPKESSLRSLWARILRVDEASIDRADNFFRMGGDSIAAMKLVSEARPAGLKLSVAQIFKNKTLADMASVAEELAVAVAPSSSSSSANPAAAAAGEEPQTAAALAPLSLLDDVPDAKVFVDTHIRPRLTDPAWRIADVYPARPLQEIAVRGSTDLPRFSVRYEALYFTTGGVVDKARLMGACTEVVARNEILRTVFVRAQNTCYGVVVENLEAVVEEHRYHSSSSDEKVLKAFVNDLCACDIEGDDITEGSSFLKWFLVQDGDGEGQTTALVMRISHAQYDEICLPVILHQLVALYGGEGRDSNSNSNSNTETETEAVATKPFSQFVQHTLRSANPASVGYWTDLLQDSPPPTVLLPDRPRADVPRSQRGHFAVQKTIEIPSAFFGGGETWTLATLPTAAWALCLARRTGRRDVLFGEVVSGRSTGLEGGADGVVGPCWQYVPFRVTFTEKEVTGREILGLVQEQHASSSAHEGMGLAEIARQCVSPGQWREGEVDWFDTVVHQAVAFVEELEFGVGDTLAAKTDTIYPHQEPLREWKIQAFVEDGGRKMTMEVVTFEAWREVAVELLDEVVECLRELVERPGEVLAL